MRNAIVDTCREYARLLCAQRERPGGIGFKGAITMLLEMAPLEAHEYLDTIKRIMEIDLKITDPEVVLMRASVIVSGATS